ncbi:hypothetical protein [Ammoniphilus sp. YIM 78166]|uniref:hypothetical protein n=1 Tax=Ammoniphilus sp. YIM 78166 TaxID=1644106 RepID=UPI00107032C0|nr:hypothetical protein [Ammoniphilus sp. YIM 78166]
MRLEDMIPADTKEQLKKIRRRRRKKNNRYVDPEELAARQFRETERLMGKYRDTYERRGGAIKKR